MIIDSSVLVAILSGESERDRFSALIASELHVRLSIANYLETHMVLSRFTDFQRRLDPLMEELAIELVPVSVSQGLLAKAAFDRFGKGRHPARLNYGDCFAYALAKDREEPLLFKGNDFSKTDIDPVAY